MSLQPMPMKKPATTRGEATPLFHSDDWVMLLRLKRELAGWLVTSDAVNYAQLAARAGLAGNSVSTFLQTDFCNMFSRTQQVAQMVGWRIDWTLEGCHYPMDPELEMMRKIAGPCESLKWQRLELNEHLIRARESQGIDVGQMAQRLGVVKDAVLQAEQKHDWLMPALLRRVRALGGVLHLRLEDCEQ